MTLKKRKETISPTYSSMGLSVTGDFSYGIFITIGLYCRLPGKQLK